MNHAQVATILNVLAKQMAQNTNRSFNHTISVNIKTNGALYRLTKRKRVIVHPDRIESGTLLDVIVTDVFDLIDSRESALQALRDKDIKVYKKSGKEAIEYLRGHLSPEDFQTWVEDIVGLV